MLPSGLRPSGNIGNYWLRVTTPHYRLPGIVGFCLREKVASIWCQLLLSSWQTLCSFLFEIKHFGISNVKSSLLVDQLSSQRSDLICCCSQTNISADIFWTSSEGPWEPALGYKILGPMAELAQTSPAGGDPLLSQLPAVTSALNFDPEKILKRSLPSRFQLQPLVYWT